LLDRVCFTGILFVLRRVERTFAWLNQFRRLRVRYEKRADIHEALLSLGCALICWRFLQVNWKPG
jgi:transposase